MGFHADTRIGPARAAGGPSADGVAEHRPPGSTPTLPPGDRIDPAGPTDPRGTPDEHDALLATRAAAGDTSALRELHRRHDPRVFTLAARILGDDDAALDASQETWLRAIRALARFRGDAAFGTWIHRIAVRTALEMVRRNTTRERAHAGSPRSGDAMAGASSDAPDPLLHRRIEEALRSLPEGMRTVLVLHDVEGYTHREIADFLGIHPGTSKSQLFKARAQMRERLR